MIHFLIFMFRDIIRREIRPNVVTVGQIAQVKLQLRLLKQKDGTFTFRELLKGIFVLHDGLSMVCCDNNINVMLRSLT